MPFEGKRQRGREHLRQVAGVGQGAVMLLRSAENHARSDGLERREQIVAATALRQSCSLAAIGVSTQTQPA